MGRCPPLPLCRPWLNRGGFEVTGARQALAPALGFSEPELPPNVPLIIDFVTAQR